MWGTMNDERHAGTRSGPWSSGSRRKHQVGVHSLILGLAGPDAVPAPSEPRDAPEPRPRYPSPRPWAPARTEDAGRRAERSIPGPRNCSTPAGDDGDTSLWAIALQSPGPGPSAQGCGNPHPRSVLHSGPRSGSTGDEGSCSPRLFSVLLGRMTQDPRSTQYCSCIQEIVGGKRNTLMRFAVAWLPPS